VQQGGSPIVQQAGGASPIVQNVASPIVQQIVTSPAAFVVQQTPTVVQPSPTYPAAPTVAIPPPGQFISTIPQELRQSINGVCCLLLDGEEHSDVIEDLLKGSIVHTFLFWTPKSLRNIIKRLHL